LFYELAEKALALEAAGKEIVRLNVGNTNLPTPKCAIEAAKKCLESKHGGGYGPSTGLPEFIDAIAEREGCEAENVVVGPGSKHLLFGLLSTLAKPGDTVCTPAPCYPAYPLACGQLMLKYETVRTTFQSGWQFSKLGPASKIAILCNPLNPSSTIYGPGLVQGAIEDAARRKSHVIIDEAYKGLSFDRIPVYNGEHVIRVRSFSKEFSMEGYRLGYAIAPKAIAKKLLAFNQATITCVPRFIQEAGLACLKNESKLLSGARGIWRKRIDVAMSALEAEGFSFAKPQSAMYLFATHKKLRDADSFALKLLDRGVAVAPGSSFGEYPQFVRICANQEENVMRGAIGKMGALVSG
jgi:aspartate aminotransferase